MAAMKPTLYLHLTFSLFTFSLLLFNSRAEISLRELESAIFALRANGYNLFGNSIAVSDLSFQILSLRGGDHGFTFLAPPNSALFSLDMAADAFSYVYSLRIHVVPRRFSFSDLRNLSFSSSPYLETLIPGHLLSVSFSRGFLSIDGVRLSFPDLYLRSGVAVHGLDGILGSSTEEHFHELSPILIPPIGASSSSISPSFDGVPVPSSQELSISIPPAPLFDGIPAPSVQEFSISIPPVGDHAFSPEFDRGPAPSPETAAICGNWSGCDDQEFLFPSFAPLMDFELEQIEKVEEEESQNQGQVQDQDHFNFAKYDQVSAIPDFDFTF